jgi:hypothetical protein
VFGSAERDALLAALDFGLQPAWAPQPPVLRTGLSSCASTGSRLSRSAVRDERARARLHGRRRRRIGVGDLVPNLDLSVARPTAAARCARPRSSASP